MRIDEHLKSFDQYLQAAGSAKSTRESYGRTLRKLAQYLEFSGRNCEMEAVRKEDITGFLAACEEIGEKRTSIILRLLICKRFFGWLKEERIIAEDPAAGIPLPKEQRRIPRYVSVQQVESLLNQPDTGTPHGLRDRALLEVLYSAGLRISEALSLELGDIDTAADFVYVRNGKGGKPRSVPVGATAIEWLARYIAEARRKLLSCSCTQLVFVNCAGARLSRQSAAAAFRAYARSAGLPEWLSPHSLRHACATHMLSGGAGLPYIQEQLGHVCMESTRVYLAVRSEELKAVHASSHPRT
jgi:site-specific recombinase XerD